jgi:hypothetical protein
MNAFAPTSTGLSQPAPARPPLPLLLSSIQSLMDARRAPRARTAIRAEQPFRRYPWRQGL